VAKSDPLVEALGAAAAEQEKDYQPTPYFKTKIKDVMVDMMDRMLTKCMDASSEAQMTSCFHERMLAGFDRDGTVEKHCAPREDIGEDVECIVFGGMGQDIASKLDNDAAAAFDWAAPEESTHHVMIQLVAQHLRDCMSSGSASDPFDCVIGGITKTLDLSASDLDPCTEFKDEDVKFGNCVGEAYGYKYMSAAIARM
jgi:DNA-binding FrmR family transcriptional regulator